METKPTLGEVIDRIGLGATHIRYVVTGGCIWFSLGLVLSMVGVIAPSVGKTFAVGPVARGMLAACVYIGLGIGNFLGGPCGDFHGRRPCILASYIFAFAFSLASGLSGTYTVLACMLCLLGTSLGIGQPVWNCMVTEISPSRWRVLLNSGSQALFTFGEMYCYILIYLQDPGMTHLDWHKLLRQTAWPTLVIFVAACVFLLRSPYFVALNGRKGEAKSILKTMKRDNCIPVGDVALDFADVEPPDAAKDASFMKFAEIFRADLRTTTFILMLSCCVICFMYSGILYAAPFVFPKFTGDRQQMSPAMSGLVGAVVELPGYALAVPLAACYARKPLIKMYLVTTAISMIGFTVGFYAQCSVLCYVCFWMMRVFLVVGYVIIYVYLGEVYPSSIRSTGCAASITAGRIGSGLGPVVYEALAARTGTFNAFFYVGTALCVFSWPLVGLLPYETFNADLSSKLREPDTSYGSIKSSLTSSDA